MAACFSVFCVPSGLTTRGSCSGWGLDDPNILCLLIWQVTFLVHLWRQNCNHLPGQLNQSSCVLGEIRRRIPKSMGTWSLSEGHLCEESRMLSLPWAHLHSSPPGCGLDSFALASLPSFLCAPPGFTMHQFCATFCTRVCPPKWTWSLISSTEKVEFLLSGWCCPWSATCYSGASCP